MSDWEKLAFFSKIQTLILISIIWANSSLFWANSSLIIVLLVAAAISSSLIVLYFRSVKKGTVITVCKSFSNGKSFLVRISRWRELHFFFFCCLKVIAGLPLWMIFTYQFLRHEDIEDAGFNEGNEVSLQSLKAKGLINFIGIIESKGLDKPTDSAGRDGCH